MFILFIDIDPNLNVIIFNENNFEEPETINNMIVQEQVRMLGVSFKIYEVFSGNKTCKWSRIVVM